MGERHDNSVISVRDRGESRRDLIRKAVRLGGAAYVAPIIVATARPISALAAVTNPDPECAGFVCGGLTPTCNGNQNCVCVTEAGGGGGCIDGLTLCRTAADCTTSDDCPSGSICAVNTCCDRPICAPLCGTVVPAALPGAGTTIVHR